MPSRSRRSRIERRGLIVVLVTSRIGMPAARILGEGLECTRNGLILHIDDAAQVEEEPLDAVERCRHQSTAPLSSRAAPRTPLTKPGASAPQYSLASSTASSIATSTGTSSKFRAS